MVVSLLTGLALAGPPEALRGDGDLVFGCASRSALQASEGLLSAGSRADTAGILDSLRSLGIDEARPFWVVLSERNGKVLPTQLHFHVPDGVRPPAMLVRMLPGSPRLQQDGTRVSVLIGGPDSGEDRGTLGLATRAMADGEGCVVAMRPSAVPQVPFPAAIGTRDDGGATAVLELDPDDPPDLAVGLSKGRALPPEFVPWLIDVLRRPAEARRRAWASTPDLPHTVLRLNNEVDLMPLVGVLYPDEQDVPDFVSKVVVEPGTEIMQQPAASEGERAKWAFVAPIRKPRTVRWWPGRIAAAARKGGQTVEKRGRVFGIHGQTEGEITWVTARRRRLIVGNDPDRVSALRKRKDGVPWFDADAVGVDVDAPGVIFRTPLQGRPMFGRVLPEEGDRVVVDVRPLGERRVE